MRLPATILALLSALPTIHPMDLPKGYRPERHGPQWHYENHKPGAFQLCSFMDWGCSGYTFGLIADAEGHCPYNDSKAWGIDEKRCCNDRDAGCYRFAFESAEVGEWKYPLRPMKRKVPVPWEAFLDTTGDVQAAQAAAGGVRLFGRLTDVPVEFGMLGSVADSWEVVSRISCLEVVFRFCLLKLERSWTNTSCALDLGLKGG